MKTYAIRSLKIINLNGDDKEVNLNFEKKVIYLTGYNGSGKSRTLNLIYNLFLLGNNKSIEFCQEDSWAAEILLKPDDLKIMGFNYHKNHKNQMLNFIKKNKGNKKSVSKILTSTSEIDALNALYIVFLQGRIATDIADVLKESRSENPINYSKYIEKKSYKILKSNPVHAVYYKDGEFKTTLISDSSKKYQDKIFNKNTSNLDISFHNLVLEYYALSGSDNEKANAMTDSVATLNKLIDDLKAKMEETLFPDNETEIATINKLAELDKFRILMNKNVQNNENITNGKVSLFFNTINNFFKLTNRVMSSDPENGHFTLTLNKKSYIFDQFSTGEKTLVTLILIVLLHSDKNVVFLLDEPDLSLHIDWQKELIKSFIKIAPNHQFIIATHSPALVGTTTSEQYINMNFINEAAQ